MRVALALIFLATLGLARSYRLPKDVIPVHYDLKIFTSLADENNNYEFNGAVNIEVKCIEPTSNITLHVKDLTIDKSHVTLRAFNGTNWSKLQVKEVTENTPDEFLIVTLHTKLEKNKIYKLSIAFRAELKDNLVGYYRSNYVGANNETHYLAATQFESTDARRAFPCFDEPEMKATFTITMGHSKKYSAISNMPQIKVEDMEDRKNFVWTYFDKSLPMSTYLVAFVVSDFASETAPPINGSNVTFKIWSRKEVIAQTQFAKSIGPTFLGYYEDFFGIKYPLPKLGMIAIPDFSAGAMENWGLVTYRESALLYDPQQTMTETQVEIANVVAHELAHQWFGNLVTMKWWTDLWLKEGFATYMAGVAVHHVFPNWNSLEEESARVFKKVLNLDSLKSSHPVSVAIGHPSEIRQAFDLIAYYKSSAIIRMMFMFLSEKTFQRGISNYLIKHKYKNAGQDDLWDSMTEQAHKDKKLPDSLTVKKVMDTWTLQTGYPVVNVDREYGKGGKGSVTVTQKRFLLDTSEESDKQCWWVPLTYTDKSESDFKTTASKHWLPCKNEAETLEVATKDDEWLLFNVQAATLVRVNYDLKNWNLLADALNSPEYTKFPVINRVQLLGDSDYLGRIGQLPYKIFFKILKYLSRDNSFNAWSSGLDGLAYVTNFIRPSSSYGLFKTYLKNFFTPIYEKLNPMTISAGSSLDAIKHQTQIIRLSCEYNAGSCIADANKKFADYKSDPVRNELQKDIKYYIICSALRQGSEEDWEFMWQQYLKSNIATEKVDILSILGCTNHVDLLKSYLQKMLDENSGIRTQDIFYVFQSVVITEVGFSVAKDFMEKNLQKIHDKISPNTQQLGYYLAPLAERSTSKKEYDWFVGFTRDNANLLEGAKLMVKQRIEQVKSNLQWEERHGAQIATFFEAE